MKHIVFTNHSVSNISQTFLNSKPTDDNHVVIKSYADSLSEINRKGHDISKVFNDQDHVFGNIMLTNLGAFTVVRDQRSDDDLANEKN